MKVNNSWESLFWSIVAKESLWNLQQEKSQTHDTNDNSNVNNKTRFLCDVQRRITYFLLFSIIPSQTTIKGNIFYFSQKKFSLQNQITTASQS